MNDDDERRRRALDDDDGALTVAELREREGLDSAAVAGVPNGVARYSEIAAEAGDGIFGERRSGRGIEQDELVLEREVVLHDREDEPARDTRVADEAADFGGPHVVVEVRH